MLNLNSIMIGGLILLNLLPKFTSFRVDINNIRSKRTSLLPPLRTLVPDSPPLSTPCVLELYKHDFENLRGNSMFVDLLVSLANKYPGVEVYIPYFYNS